MAQNWGKDFLRIRKVASDSGHLKIIFENGDEASLDYSRIRPEGLNRLEWHRARVDGDGLHVVIPGQPHDFTIPWHLVRRLTDNTFSREMKNRAEKQARLVGQRLRKLRKRRGLTQAKLAQLADIETANLSRLENGRFNISATTLWKILDALGFSITALAESPPTDLLHTGSVSDLDECVSE